MNTSTDLSPATIGKLKLILEDPAKYFPLKMELAIVIDAGEPFVKTTYTLEGDGPLVLHTYEEVRKLYNIIAVPMGCRLYQKCSYIPHII